MRSCVLAPVLLALLECVAFPVLSQAQVPVRLNSNGALFEAGLASATIDGYQRSSLSEMASSFWGANGRLSGVGSVNLTRFASGNTTAYGEVHGSLALSADAHNLSAFGVEGGAGSYRGRTSSRYALSSLVLGRTSSAGSAAGWIKGGLGVAGGATTHATAHAEVGGAINAAATMLDGTLSYTTIDGTRYTDAVAHAQWPHLAGNSHGTARFVGGVEAGLRFADINPETRAWVALTAALRLYGPVSVVAYAGAPPPDPVRATPGVSFTSVALRISLGPTGLVRPAAGTVPRATSVSSSATDGLRVITVMLADAKNVELMGDFTGWLPVTMSRVTPGIWQARVDIGHGSHRMNIRTDAGAWIPPPGLPVSDDDFGGTVGILAVP